MKPSDQAKQAGLKSLAQLSRLCDVSQDTLIRWHRERPKVFEALVQWATTT